MLNDSGVIVNYALISLVYILYINIISHVSDIVIVKIGKKDYQCK